MIRLVTLGGIDLRGPSGPLSGRIVQPRHLALLALLARTPGAPLTREKVVGLLWPEVPERKARRRLSDVLYAVRQELGKEVVVSSAGRLRLDADRVESDVADFEEALDRGELERAVGLYQGPFLDGFYVGGAHGFDEWMERERRDLARRHRETLEHLAGRAEDGGDWPGAVRWWRRRAASDPTNSRVAARLMQALAASGNVPRAVAHLRVHEEALRRELDLPVSEELRALKESLTARELETEGEGSTPGSPSPRADAEAPSPPPSPNPSPSPSPPPSPSPSSSPNSRPPSPSALRKDIPEPRRRGADREGEAGNWLRTRAAPRLLTLALALVALSVGALWLLRGAATGSPGSDPGTRAGPDQVAWDHYEQGNAYLARRFSEDAVKAAIGQFERATALDPTFAAAWRNLIHARLWLVWVLDDPQEGERARNDLEQLMKLDSDDPDVRMGKGWFLYYGQRRYAEALEEFEAAAAARPDAPDVLRVVAFLQQRLGRWDEAMVTLERTMEMAPRDAELAFSAGQTLRWMGRPEEALDLYGRAFSLVPEEDVGFLLSNVEHAHLALGDTATARTVRERARRLGAGAWQGGRAELYHGDPEGAMERIRDLPAPSAQLRMFRLDALADAAGRMGDVVGRRLYADSLLELARAHAPERMEGPRGQAVALAWIFVGLAHIHRGEPSRGMQAVERGLALEAPFNDAVVGPLLGAVAARAFVRAGEPERALGLLARVSFRPAVFSPFDLAMDPEWDPLRDHPRWMEISGSEVVTAGAAPGSRP